MFKTTEKCLKNNQISFSIFVLNRVMQNMSQTIFGCNILKNKSIIVLVPEIALIIGTYNILDKFFPNYVVSWHSKMKKTEKKHTLNDCSELLAIYLRAIKNCEVLGPEMSLVSRIKGNYVKQILLKMNINKIKLSLVKEQIEKGIYEPLN